MFTEKQMEKMNKAISEAVVDAIIYCVKSDDLVVNAIYEILDDEKSEFQKILKKATKEYLAKNHEDIIAAIIKKKLGI